MRFKGLTTISLAALAVLVAYLVGALIVVGYSLLDAQAQLGTAERPLQSIISHTDPLAYQVNQVNGNLTGIEQALHPVHGQAGSINSSLGSAQTDLASTDSGAAAVDTQASAIAGHLGAINLNLASTDHSVSAATPTVAGILDEASRLGRLLQPIQSDLFDVTGELANTNYHVASTCHKLPPTNGSC